MSNGMSFLSPSNPWFWLLAFIGAFLVLLATGHTATAVTLLFSGIALICLIANITNSSSSVVWWIFGISLVLALGIGLTLVPAEW